MPSKDTVQAVVTSVILDGAHGPYAVASHDEIGYITFSLDSSVWDGDDDPEPGETVNLSKLRHKQAGWRANCGHRIRPQELQQ